VAETQVGGERSPKKRKNQQEKSEYDYQKAAGNQKEKREELRGRRKKETGNTEGGKKQSGKIKAEVQ